jgi:hypothetical protein
MGNRFLVPSVVPGGMTLLSTTTLTGASITISSIPATYVDLYLVIRNGRTATSGANFLMRINSDTANRYDENSANTIANGTFPNSSWMIAFNSDSGASTSLATVSIFDYANTTTWKSATNLSITNNPGVPANFNAIRYMQFYNQTPAISSLTIFPSTGNWTSGTAYLYGVK